MAAKWRAFGYHVIHATGTHLGLCDAVDEAKKTLGCPLHHPRKR
jgi:transketolase N-terminal domain/subunit